MSMPCGSSAVTVSAAVVATGDLMRNHAIIHNTSLENERVVHSDGRRRRVVLVLVDAVGISSSIVVDILLNILLLFLKINNKPE